MYFYIVDSNGDNIKCDVIGMFNYEDKNFIIYTDYLSSDDEKEIYASLYCMDNGNIRIKDIIDENDWNLVDKYLEGI